MLAAFLVESHGSIKPLASQKVMGIRPAVCCCLCGAKHFDGVTRETRLKEVQSTQDHRLAMTRFRIDGSGLPQLAFRAAGRKKLLCISLIAGTAIFSFFCPGVESTSQKASGTSGAKVDFNRDIRPIISENCYKCHGPDGSERKARLRLDIREEALKPAKSGERAIVPGAPDKSKLVERTSSTDPDELMPPVKSGKKLTQKQIELLRNWVGQGAPYAAHWAYVKPMRPALPKVQNKAWPRNPIDYFILARLEREKLKPSPEADRYTLIRRASLDLTGLSPTLAEVDQFVMDRSPNAYERLVDRLLTGEAFGEHWARMWLDLVRYADSAGYADDPPRSIWAFRDYVIKSFNSNKPFDRFTLEQIAGDLLPDATEEDLVATACHRNTMTNSEGGTNDEEFRNAAVVDRVNTTMAVWMGTSMACAQCHNHKYDPISQKEYFQFFAILNNTEDADRNDETPVFKFYTTQEKRQRNQWETEASSLRQKLKSPTPQLLASEAKWEKDFPLDLQWASLKPSVLKAKSDATISTQDDGTVLVAAGAKTDVYTVNLPLTNTRLTALRLDALPQESLPRKGPGHAADGSFVVSRITASLLPPQTNRTRGRFVRLELPGKEKYLSLAEVQIFSGNENVALKGSASQSSTAYDGFARLAIDGNNDGDYERSKSTTHTELSENPWWEVDLQQEQPIDRILIWNRTDGALHTRLSDFRIAVLDKQRELLWDKTVKEPPNPSMEFRLDGSRSIRLTSAFADTSREGIDPNGVLKEKADKKAGWTAGPGDGQQHTLMLLPEKPVEAVAGSNLRVIIEQTSELENHTLGCFRIAVSDDERAPERARTPAAIRKILELAPGAGTDSQRTLLVEYYLGEVAPELKTERERLAELKRKLDQMKPSTVPIMHELAGEKRRKTHIQFRGNFMALGDEVSEGVPAAFHSWPEDAPRNRLQLARWLVAPENPLTPRVIANRFWEQIFGIGIVRTSEEFGSQGDLPTHPELLDWLAKDDVFNRRRKEMLDMIAVTMAGRIAEEIISGDISTGAAGDIQQATHLARAMVCHWGMSDKLGMVQYGDNNEFVFLGREMIRSKDYSETTAQEIDTEVKRIIDEQYKIAHDIIHHNRDKLEVIANCLLEYETLDGSQVEEIVRTGRFNPPAPTPQVEPPTGAQAATPLPEVPKPLPPKLDPGLGATAPATA